MGQKRKLKDVSNIIDSDNEESINTVTVPKAKKRSKTSAHRDSLAQLRQSDPEFYEFLSKEDKGLLEFEGDVSDTSDDDDEGGKATDDDDDDDDSSDGDSDSSSAAGDDELPKKLEVQSGSEDDDEEEDADVEKEPKKLKIRPSEKRTLVTVKMVNQWSRLLQEENSLNAMKNVVSAFKAALQQTGGAPVEGAKFQVQGSAVFNAVVSACVRYLVPMLQRLLGIPPNEDPKKPVLPSNCSKWKKVRLEVKSYLGDIIQLMSNLASSATIDVIMRHVRFLPIFYVPFPRLAKIFLKKLIALWSTAEETTRVLSLLSINKLLRLLSSSLLEYGLKQMYMEYVRNCKFTSPSTLHNINFMQRSLVEMFRINPQQAYQYAFIYIRQLAIHLRNALTVRKKDNTQTVTNWQFLHSLSLWRHLLSDPDLQGDESIQSLVYPLTQTIIGTIKLVSSAHFYPLRFHCLHELNVLSDATSTYIPVLPFLIETLDLPSFRKKPHSSSMKPFNFDCILKLTKPQLHEKSFTDCVVEKVYELTLEHCNTYAHTIGFPELVLPALVQLKKFVKDCRTPNYTKQIKQLVTRLDETSQTITQRRKSANINLKDFAAVSAWEARSKTDGTPLSKFYINWSKLNERKNLLAVTGKEKMSSKDDIPRIQKPVVAKKASEEERKEFSALFEGSDSDDDDQNRFLLKEERPKKSVATKTKEMKPVATKKRKASDGDDYSDFDDEELTMLARSGSEDDNDENDEDDKDDEEQDDEELESSEAGDDKPDIVEDFKFSDNEN